jgi:hypothetical protein
MLEVFNLSGLTAMERDRPIMRCWNGQNDNSITATWDAYVVEEYKNEVSQRS